MWTSEKAIIRRLLPEDFQIKVEAFRKIFAVLT
jgi:hypothetical protein